MTESLCDYENYWHNSIEEIKKWEYKMTTQQHYGLKKTVSMGYDETLEKTIAALKDQGFGVLTEINVQATLKNKLDVDFKQYIILGACNPPLAYQALQADEEVGLLLPCNVIVYEGDGGETHVSMMQPQVMLGVTNNPDVMKVADDALARLEKALAAI
jgi:uncharacterized protein (DUF302 family)